MLLANPHHLGLTYSYGMKPTAPGIDAYGATLVGLPVLEIAFNNFLAGLTQSTPMGGMPTT